LSGDIIVYKKDIPLRRLKRLYFTPYFCYYSYMYKKISAVDYKNMLGFPKDYKIDGFIIYGTYKTFPFEQIEESLMKLKIQYSITRLEDFLSNIAEITIGRKKYWFTIAYGGAMLSEHLHLACLFGSKKNILIGTCGGLKKGAENGDLVIPNWSFANESSAKAYQPDVKCKYESDRFLNNRLIKKLAPKHTLHRGATITFQAMLAETWEDILKWSELGYVGVEMEAATVFATSNSFKVPASAVLIIGDNLIEKETFEDDSAKNKHDQRMQISQDIFDAVVEEILRAN